MLTQKKKFKLPQISSVCINGIMVFVLLVVLVPMLNLVAKSFSDPAKVAGMPGWQIIPAGFSLINYEIIFSNPAIWRALLNSVFITVVGVALQRGGHFHGRLRHDPPRSPRKKAVYGLFHHDDDL